MGDDVVYVLMRDIVQPMLFGDRVIDKIIYCLPLGVFRDRMEAECEMQRFQDGCRNEWKRFDGSTHFEYRVEDVMFHG